MSVAVTPQVDGKCVVTASFTTDMIGTSGVIQTTLYTLPDARGPWVQVHEADGWESSAMTQAFNVLEGVPVTFYMNGENHGSTAVQTQNTRIWVVCGEEGIAGAFDLSEDFSERTIPEGAGN